LFLLLLLYYFHALPSIFPLFSSRFDSRLDLVETFLTGWPRFLHSLAHAAAAAAFPLPPAAAARRPSPTSRRSFAVTSAFDAQPRSRYALVRSSDSSDSEREHADEGADNGERSPPPAADDSQSVRQRIAVHAPAVSPVHPSQSGKSRARAQQELDEEHEQSAGCLQRCIRRLRRQPAYGSLPSGLQSHALHSFDSQTEQVDVMDLFRSEDMKYVAITMTNDSANATVRELGKMNKLHVIDVGRHSTALPHAQTEAEVGCTLPQSYVLTAFVLCV